MRVTRRSWRRQECARLWQVNTILDPANARGRGGEVSPSRPRDDSTMVGGDALSTRAAKWQRAQFSRSRPEGLGFDRRSETASFVRQQQHSESDVCLPSSVTIPARMARQEDIEEEELINQKRHHQRAAANGGEYGR